MSDNEAAHTLLTIGNRSLQSLLAHIDPSGEDYSAGDAAPELHKHPFIVGLGGMKVLQNTRVFRNPDGMIFNTAH